VGKSTFQFIIPNVKLTDVFQLGGFMGKCYGFKKFHEAFDFAARRSLSQLFGLSWKCHDTKSPLTLVSGLHTI
jgi:hypothetical protein